MIDDDLIRIPIRGKTLATLAVAAGPGPGLLAPVYWPRSTGPRNLTPTSRQADSYWTTINN